MIEAIVTKAFLAKAATVIAGLSLATTGAGAANVLPQVAQDRVAAAVEKASPLDLPDSQDPSGGTGKADKAEKAAETEKPAESDAEKPEKNEKAKDNFGAIVSAKAHSTDDKGKGFGQSVSAEARARAAARQKAKPDHEADDDSTEDDDAGEADDGPSVAKSHRPADVPAANRGSGHRP
jgi:hypothetical protein